MAQDFRSAIDRFYGLHQCDDGESRLKRGESPEMKNLTVTGDYTLIQRDGWERVCDTRGVGRGLYVGDIITWVVSENVYVLENGEAKLVGTLDSSEGDVFIFPFESKLYYLDGTKIKVWNGTSFSNIIPYVPTVAVSCNYMGAGVPFEDVNLLTGLKKVSYTPDGFHTGYMLPERDIEKVTAVYLNGRYISTSKYNVDTAQGMVSFPDGISDTTPNSLVIHYSKPHGMEALIHRMRYAIAYGGENDTRVFLWGDSEYPFHLRYSGVHDGMSGMDYFPELSFNKIGTKGRLTSAIRHYDKLVLFTVGEAFQCEGEVKQDSSGMSYTVYPVRTVSSQVGCEVDNFPRLINNNPVTLSGSGLYQWSSSSIRDERNANEIGERIQSGLKSLGKTGVRSFDRATASELYIWKDDRVYVYNYSLDVFYYYEGFDAVDFGEDSDGRTWFVRRDGALCRFCDEKKDDGVPIPFLWRSGYEEHCGLDTKNIHAVEFQVYPVSTTDFIFSWVSDRLMGRYENLEIEYSLMSFSDIRFDDFTFYTAATPLKLRKRIKAKRVRGFKLTVESGEGEGVFHLLGIAVTGRKTDTQ